MLAHPAVRSLAAAIFVVAFVMPARPAGSQQPSAAAIATAKELITVKGAAAVFEPIVPGVIEQARAILLRTNPMLGKDLGEVAAQLRTEYGPRSSELLEEAAKLYATRFTVEELKDALAFYKSPLGRKIVDQEAIVVDETMRNAQVWANRLSEEVLGKFRVEMKKRGHEI